MLNLQACLDALPASVYRANAHRTVIRGGQRVVQSPLSTLDHMIFHHLDSDTDEEYFSANDYFASESDEGPTENGKQDNDNDDTDSLKSFDSIFIDETPTNTDMKKRLDQVTPFIQRNSRLNYTNNYYDANDGADCMFDTSATDVEYQDWDNLRYLDKTRRLFEDSIPDNYFADDEDNDKEPDTYTQKTTSIHQEVKAGHLSQPPLATAVTLTIGLEEGANEDCPDKPKATVVPPQKNATRSSRIKRRKRARAVPTKSKVVEYGASESNGPPSTESLPFWRRPLPTKAKEQEFKFEPSGWRFVPPSRETPECWVLDAMAKREAKGDMVGLGLFCIASIGLIVLKKFLR